MANTTAVHPAYDGFNAGNIMSDYIMSDYTSMSESSIQSFLKSKNSCNNTNTSLANIYPDHNYHIVNGHFVCMAEESFDGESAAHIIWQAAQDYRINPKVLIVLLEKEQGLITDTWPNSDLQYRSATGYGCPDTAACDSQYYGFKNQVRNSAKFFRKNLDGDPNWTNYPIGRNSVLYNPDQNCGSSIVNIENLATGALYTYTPYQPKDAVLNANPGTTVHCGAYGNSNFYRLFTSWFGDTHATLSSIHVSGIDTYTFKTSTGKYIAAAGDTIGSRIIISSNASEANRQFKFERSGDFYVIRNVATGLVLDVAGGGTTNGVGVQLYTANGTCSQKWYFADNKDNGSYTLRSACSWKALDVPGGNMNTEGLELQIYDNNKTASQQYKLIDTASAAVSDGVYVPTTLSEKTMDIVDGKTANGTKLHTFEYTYGNNQQFSFTRAEDGYYTIKNMASGRVLDVAGGSKDNGAMVQLYDYNSTCAQKWIVEKTGLTGYLFLSACSSKAIDVPGGNINNVFQKLQIYTLNNTNAQKWQLHKLNTLADGNYEIVSALDSKKVADITAGTDRAKNGTNIQLYTSNGTNAQKFQVAYNAAQRAYIIKNPTTNRVLDVSGGLSSNGANVHIWDWNGTCAQFWHLHKRTDGKYSLYSACSDKVLDVSGGNSSNGTNIQTWSSNDTDSQKWTFNKI